MKIFYLINSRLPSEKAEGLEAMKLCEALAEQAELVLVAPRRLNKIKEDPFNFYGVNRNFKIVKLPVIDVIPFGLGAFGFLIEAISFALASFFYILFVSRRRDIVFSHEQICLFGISFVRKNVFYDIHDFPKSKPGFYRRLFKNIKGITTTNNWKKEELTRRFVLPPEKIMSWPNGVDITVFDINVSKKEAREKLNLPQDKILVGYVGMLKTMGMAKGIDTAIESLNFLDKNIKLVLVGGRPEDVKEYEELVKKSGLSERANFIGWVMNKETPVYLKAFDILIAPFPKTDHYEFFMCPMKILEYMASQRPIVASDLHSIREILNDEQGVLVKPDDAPDLARGIKLLVENSDLAQGNLTSAFLAVKKYTWEARAEKIINFIKLKTQ